MSIFGTTSGTIDGRGQSRLAACPSGAFVLFVLAGAVCISKNKNHSKIHRWQVPCSFAGAEMQPDRERPAEHTFRMVKGIDAVWADFCPATPCLPLFMDGKYTIIQKLPCVKSKSSSSRPKEPPEKTTCQMDHTSVITEHISGGSDRVSHRECEIRNVTLPMS